MDQITTPKILVVDDVEANRFALRDIIRQAGYTPVLTESGMQAIKVLERTQIDLVILDIAMPEMDGFEVCRQIKENVRTREIPIIFTSALDNPQDIKQGFACGEQTTSQNLLYRILLKQELTSILNYMRRHASYRI